MSVPCLRKFRRVVRYNELLRHGLYIVLAIKILYWCFLKINAVLLTAGYQHLT